MNKMYGMFEHWWNQERREITKPSLFHTTLSESGSFFKSKWLTIPQNPNRAQKVYAYLMVKLGRVDFVRREDDYINYAYRMSAREILRW